MITTLDYASENLVDVPMTPAELAELKSMVENSGTDAIAVFWFRRLLLTVETTQKRLDDAETTISKIGFCAPVPHEAMARYGQKYKVRFEDIEHRVVKL